MITTKYPSVSKAWLLTGEGEMFVEQVAASASQAGVPYYGMDILAAVDETVLPSPQFYISIPIFDNCDIAAQNIGTAMLPEIAPGAIVILKRWNVESIVPGESYLVVTEQFKGIRTIRAGSNPSCCCCPPIRSSTIRSSSASPISSSCSSYKALS